MIFKILFIICVTLFVALFVTFFEDLKRSNRKRISFKEAMDLTELPVVTFIGRGRKLNFLIDTGANNSILNESVVNKMKLKCEEFEGVETNTAGGNINLNKVTNLTIKFDDKREYNECFLISNMDEAFNSVKEETGVMIHGILGSNFFAKNKYIIDFDSLALYVK
jgi:predicted aspartyl protease